MICMVSTLINMSVGACLYSDTM